MKANEAPEKIWMTDEWVRQFDDKDFMGEDSVEYIRKDAFIEKACDAYCKVCGHYPHTVPTHICRNNCDYFSDFKKYMEDKA